MLKKIEILITSIFSFTQNFIFFFLLGLKNLIIFSWRIKVAIANRLTFKNKVAPPGWLSGQRVRLMTWWFKFDPRLRQLFFLAYFHLSPLQKHVRKEVGGFGRKSGVSTGVRKSGNTYASPTAMIWHIILHVTAYSGELLSPTSVTKTGYTGFWLMSDVNRCKLVTSSENSDE